MSLLDTQVEENIILHENYVRAIDKIKEDGIYTII